MDDRLVAKNYKSAIDDFSKAINLNSNIASFYLHRGFAKYNLYDNKGACQDVQKGKQVGFSNILNDDFEYLQDDSINPQMSYFNSENLPELIKLLCN